MSEGIRVQMLGNFTLQVGDNAAGDGDNRSRKVWLLLAYLIYNRKKHMRQEELFELLWGDMMEKEDPNNALRAILHRIRGVLDKLQDGLGHKMIVRRQGSYAWNSLGNYTVDVEEFQKLCDEAFSLPKSLRLPLLQEAIALYKGDFLQNFSAENWVAPVAVSYHNLYLRAVQEVLELLNRDEHRETRITLCRNALRIEPYSEDLHRCLLQNLLSLGRYREVVSSYEEMSKRFFDDLGVLPPEECRNLYYEAIRAVNDTAIGMETLQEQLKEPPAEGGAMVCDFDFFKSIYHSTARLMERSGVAVHIAMISIADPKGEPMGKRKLAHAMDNIENEIRSCLRRGDVISRCSPSQFVIMLPMANYENSCMVCERVKKSYARKYPHSLARMTYVVQSLEASEAARSIF